MYPRHWGQKGEGMRETIPEDLKVLYDLAQNHQAWCRSAHDIITEDGKRESMWELTALIERIAKAEARIKEMYAALILIRAYAIREMRQQDIDALEKLLEQVRSEIKPQ